MTNNPHTQEIVKTAIPTIVEALRQWGVFRVEWFEAFYGFPVIWLVTSTDAEKAAVDRQDCFVSTVRDIVRSAGLDAALAQQTLVTVESEETVTRDWQGNWWHAMK